MLIKDAINVLLKCRCVFVWIENFPTVISGIRGMRVLKTTQSSFENFVYDAYRTLPDVADRIFR